MRIFEAGWEINLVNLVGVYPLGNGFFFKALVSHILP